MGTNYPDLEPGNEFRNGCGYPAPGTNHYLTPTAMSV